MTKYHWEDKFRCKQIAKKYPLGTGTANLYCKYTSTVNKANVF